MPWTVHLRWNLTSSRKRFPARSENNSFPLMRSVPFGPGTQTAEHFGSFPLSHLRFLAAAATVCVSVTCCARTQARAVASSGTHRRCHWQSVEDELRRIRIRFRLAIMNSHRALVPSSCQWSCEQWISLHFDAAVCVCALWHDTFCYPFSAERLAARLSVWTFISYLALLALRCVWCREK